MKCEIIKDLLPSYVDGLTSPESNEVIKEHLEQCSDCKTYYLNMCEDLNNTNVTSKIENINPFIKIRQDNLRKIILAVFVAVALLVVAVESYKNYWTYGKSTFSHEMTLSCQKVDDITKLVFEPTDERTRLMVGFQENVEVDGILPYVTIGIAKYNEKASTDERFKNGYFNMIFLDKNTFIPLDTYPKITNVSDEDVLAIKYDERTILVNICDLYEGKITIL